MDDNSNSVASLPPEDVVVKEEIEDVPPADVDLEEETDQESSNGFAQIPAPSENQALSIEALYACLSFTKHCYLCYSVFPSTSALNSHFTTDHYGAPDTSHHRCGFCGFAFRSDAILKEHRAALHSNEGEDRPWACEACGDRFGEWRGLRAHRQRKCGLRAEMENISLYWVGKQAQPRARNYSRVNWTWRCEQCPVLFAQVAELKKHRQRSHGMATLLTEENLVNKEGILCAPELPANTKDESSCSSSTSSSNYQQIPRARDVIAPKVSQNGAKTPSISNLTAPSQSPVARPQQAASSITPTPSRNLTLPKPSPPPWYCCPLCCAMFQHMTSLKTHQRYHHSNASNPAGVPTNPSPKPQPTTKLNPFKRFWQCELCTLQFPEQVHLANHLKDVHLLTPQVSNLVAMVGNVNPGAGQVVLSGSTQGVASSSQKKSSATKKVKKYILKNTKIPKKNTIQTQTLSPPPKRTGPRPKNRYQLASEGEPSSSSSLDPAKSKLDRKKPARQIKNPTIWPRPGAWETDAGPAPVRTFTSPTGMSPVSCPLCPATTTQRALHLHLSIHLIGRPWRCPLCPSSFGGLGALKLHLTRLHPGHEWDEPRLLAYQTPPPEEGAPDKEPDKALNCPLCPAASYYTHEISLRTHLEAHTVDDPWTCEVCGIPFCRLTSLQEHRKLVHSLTTDVLEQEGVVLEVTKSQAIFKCEKCPASYKGSPASLKQHMKAHRHVQPVICEFCGVYFGHERGLLSHQSTGACKSMADSAAGGDAKRKASDDAAAEELEESETKKRRTDDDSCLSQDLPKQLFEAAEDPIA